MNSEYLQLPIKVNVDAAHEILDRIASRGGVNGVLIDASEVADVDGPAVVALAALACAAETAGGKITLKAPTPALLSAFADLGLNRDLEKMEVVK